MESHYSCIPNDIMWKSRPRIVRYLEFLREGSNMGVHVKISILLKHCAGMIQNIPVG